MDTIDFRSDTVTWPTPAMRDAMAAAAVGDDVYEEDPTVNELEAIAAERLGKEAGLFVASGTMGNLAAILSWAGRGEEAIAAAEAHVLLWEAGGMAALGGVVPRPLPIDDDGRMSREDIEAAVRGDDPHLPRSRLVLVENSFGNRDGAPLEAGYFDGVREVANRHGLRVHLDGARLFNAATALGSEPRELARSVDSVTVCLSKGLCAPAGSVLCGSRELVHRARRIRKSLGGGMRQVGVLAAAGRIALLEMTLRLADDHRNARRLADGLAGVAGIRIDPGRVRTNIVFFELTAEVGLNAESFVEAVREESGIRLGPDGSRLRAVTHYWIEESHVEALIAAVRRVVERA